MKKAKKVIDEIGLFIVYFWCTLRVYKNKGRLKGGDNSRYNNFFA
ncbi:hypothetical protein ROSEINA2194_03632 [Roseburia inulinivorans DSM 16841]|uniref:Uncharacterized protein n=1 Tax=Roseburia inulinivorans DSM 16841 TaxID=622312 RepID=C0FXZ3_9FIRM|nr:hypothetical protein ROSEINA2194_03632 [Roseburia inulinivorans DSM 16841]